MTIKELIKAINKKEWLFVGLVAILVLIITSAPYLYGWLKTAPDEYYLGIHSLSPGDQYVYYSYLEQVKQGNWLFKDLHTSEPQTYKYLNIFWLSLGLLGRLLNTPNILTFHLGRLLLIVIFLPLSYLFLSYFFQEKIKRKLAFIFLIFSSGSSALFVSWFEKIYYEAYGYYHWPMDLWVPEAYPFLTLYQSPHFIASLLLIMLVFFLMLLAFENNKIFYSIGAGISGLILFQFHPFHVPVIFGVLGVFLLMTFLKARKIIWAQLKHCLILLLASLPAIFYYLFLMEYDWITVQKAIQNVCLTPALWLGIVSYGLLFPLALTGVCVLIKKPSTGSGNNRFIFLIVWLAVQFALMYSPFNFQRRLSEGLFFPLVILAIIALFFLYDFLKRKVPDKYFELLFNNKILLFYFFIVFFCFSNIFAVARDFSLYQKKYSLFYISQEKVRAMEWLKDNLGEEEVILSHPATGNLIPGLSGRTVFIGHQGVETLFFHEKNGEVKWFFGNNKKDDRKRAFLKRNNISYLFYSDWEKTLGDFQPREKDYLKKVYENNEVEIYQLQNSTGL